MTAVEFIIKKFNDKIDYIPINKWDEIREIVQQAIEMEKQQIMEAWHNGKINEQDFFSDHTGTIVRANCAEKYYDRTYKSTKK